MKEAKKTTRKKTINTKNTREALPSFERLDIEPNYKDVLVLRRFINDRGKVLPQKYTSSRNQRKLSSEVKKARFMGLLPYTDRHML